MSRYVKDANGVWHAVAGLEAIDSTPTQGSTAAVSSGGVYASEQTIKQALKSKAPYQNIGLTGSASTLESDLNNVWSSLPNTTCFLRISNQSTIYHGTMMKYSDTIGTMQFMDAEGVEYEFIKGVGLTSPVLYFTNVACSATTGNFLTKSDGKITGKHVVAECTFANPSAITSDVTWTTANGSVTLNGTCASATTANLVLVKKGN